MGHVEIQSLPTSPVSKPAFPRLFVVRFIISSALSVVGLITFFLTGPVMGRMAAVDPALEGLYLALVVGWCWSLARMWSLTCEARHHQKTT